MGSCYCAVHRSFSFNLEKRSCSRYELYISVVFTCVICELTSTTNDSFRHAICKCTKISVLHIKYLTMDYN